MFFFFMTVMFGSFYLINLMLAVVSMAYTEEMENQGKVGIHFEVSSFTNHNACKI